MKEIIDHEGTPHDVWTMNGRPLSKGKLNDLKRDFDRKNGKKTTTIRYKHLPEGVEMVLEAFKPINPTWTAWTSNKTQVEASRALFDTYGIEVVKEAIAYYVEHKNEQYIPSINSPYDLATKFPKLKSYKDKARTTPSSASEAGEIIL